MKKINEVGIKLIEYKDELTKNYPKIVTDSLFYSLEQMVDNQVIDLGTYEIIRNSQESKEDFLDYLLSNEKYIKSYEELFAEYDITRRELDEELKMHDLFTLKTETKVETDSILVLKTFSIDEQFVADYFGVDEEEIVKLMKRKGFIEKYTALRLIKVLKDIINQGKRSFSLIKLDHSLAYFAENGDGYNIDLIIEIPIDNLLVLEKKNAVLVEIKEVNGLADRIYRTKTTS